VVEFWGIRYPIGNIAIFEFSTKIVAVPQN